MNDPTAIQYLTHANVDKVKWDGCISKANNGLIYAYSFYLDQMAKNWDALVWGNYEMVMPLPWNSKYSIHYIYQPFLTAQLGVFGVNITEQITGEFIRAIPSKFKLIELSLNAGNIFSVPTGFSILRNNYVLECNRSYDELYQDYRDNIKRNIKKCFQLGCRVEKDFDPEHVIALAVQQMRHYGKESADNVQRFRKLYQYLHSHNMAITYGINSDRNELLASCVFFFSHNRAYYILVGNHPNGKTIGASHALIDAFIKDHAGKNMLLDFEGSDIRNLAFFYSSFGAKEEKYPAIRLNRLPFYLRWMK